MKYIVIFSYLILFLYSCNISKYKKTSENEVFKCYCYEKDIRIYYMNHLNFDTVYMVFMDTLKKKYLHICLPDKLLDTLEMFVNNEKIMELCEQDRVKLNQHIFLDYSKYKKSPLLTVTRKGKYFDCLQIIIDERYRVLTIQWDDESWYASYSNFYFSVL